MAARSELSIHHIIALLLRSVLKRLPDCAGVQKLKTFCTVWDSLTIVSASAKKIEQLLAFLPARKSGSFELPRASFFDWIFDIGAVEGYKKENCGAPTVYIKEMAVILPSCHCRLTELTIVSIINLKNIKR